MFNLIEAADIKNRAPKLNLGEDYDAILGTRIIPALTLQLAQYCRRPDWDNISRTEYFSPDLGRKKLFVASPPIVAAPAIQVWESSDIPRLYDATTLLTENEDYIIDEKLGVIEKLGTWAHGPKVVKVVYTGGYLTAHGQGAPQDLVEAAVRQAILALTRTGQIGLNTQSVEGAAITLSAGLRLDPSVTDILTNYAVYPG